MKKWIPFLVVLSFWSLHYLSPIDPYLHLAGWERLIDFSISHLEEAGKDAAETFLVLSTLKGGLALLQSTLIGVSFIADFQIQVGQLLQHVQESVTRAWQYSFAAMSVLETLSLVLKGVRKSALNVPVHLLFGCAIPLTLLPAAKQGIIGIIRFTAKWVSLWVIAIYFLFPIGTATSAIVAEWLFIPEQQELRGNMAQSHNHLFLPEQEKDLSKHAHDQVKDYEKNPQKAKEDFSILSGHLNQHIALLFAHIIIFPLGIFVFIGCWFIVIARKLNPLPN